MDRLSFGQECHKTCAYVKTLQPHITKYHQGKPITETTSNPQALKLQLNVSFGFVEKALSTKENLIIIKQNIIQMKLIMQNQEH